MAPGMAPGVDQGLNMFRPATPSMAALHAQQQAYQWQQQQAQQQQQAMQVRDCERERAAGAGLPVTHCSYMHPHRRSREGPRNAS